MTARDPQSGRAPDPRRALDPDRLAHMAAQLTGLSDLGPDDWRLALKRLATSMIEDGMPRARIARVIPHLVGALANRAMVLAAHAAAPALGERPIHRPIFITGFPRTGTTLMHNLLATHPDHTAHPLWMLQRPVAPPGADEAWRRARRAETAAILQQLAEVSPGFARIHPMGVDWPDECSWLLRNSFASLVFALQYPVPGYMRWLVRQADVRPAYRFHRQQVQVLDARLPGGRVVGKDPCHLWHLEALFDVWPDATVIQLHRHPFEALPSLASLCASLHAIDHPRLDPHAVGRYALELAGAGLDAMHTARETLGSARIIDVRYRDFVADPVGTVHALLERLDSPVNPGVTHRIEDWLAAHPKDARGRHRYSLEQFGLSEDELLGRFGGYIERFGLSLRAAPAPPRCSPPSPPRRGG